MTRSARTLAAALTTAVALTITGSMINTAEAKPASAGAHAKADKAAKGGKAIVREQRMVLQAITRLSTALDRNVKPSRIEMLPTEQQDALLANVEADQGILAALREDVLAADSALDLRQVRTDLKSFRVENYLHATNALVEALELQAELAAYPDLVEAAALVAGAVEKALTVTAESPRSLLQEIRADLAAAQELLEAAAAVPVVEEPVVEEPVVG